MSLIDRKALINQMESHIYWGDSVIGLLEVAKNAPAVKAVEVVRCRDCDHADDCPAEEGYLFCSLTEMVVKEIDFCSNGIPRRDD